MVQDKLELSTHQLAQYYLQEIEEALSESEHVYNLTINYEILEYKINELMTLAATDGFGEKKLWDLIQARIPSYVNYQNHKTSHKKAA